jgi:hypothetical protein
MLAALMSSVLSISSMPLFAADTSLYAPGEIDLRLSHTKETTNFNPIMWGQALTAGMNTINRSGSNDEETAGVYLRPNANQQGLADIVLGVEYFNQDQSLWEAQAHIIMPSGFGFGGGFVESPYGTDNLWFAKLIYQQKHGDVDVLVSPLLESNESNVSLGGYGAVYNDSTFLGGNINDEQWRITGALIAPENTSLFRPAIEMRYTDATIGDHDGSKTSNVHITFKYVGGFFRNSSRLGRALGPAANVYQNPVSYLGSNWNRLADLWEIGDLTNLRVTHKELVDGSDFTNVQAIAFPAQYARVTNWTAGFLLGYEGNFYDEQADEDIAILGYSKKFGNTRYSLIGKRNSETHIHEITLGFVFAP